MNGYDYRKAAEMKWMLAALAASLVAASAVICAPARAQQPSSSPTTAAPRNATPAPAAPSGRGTGQPVPARAARPPPIYRVELVIFRATSALGASEDWAAEAGTAPVTSSDADPGASASERADTAPPSGAAPSGAAASGVVGIVPSSEFQLEGVVSRLRASGRYVPVAHVAWMQTASPWEKPVETPLQSVGLDADGLTGTVALERGVYLHLALDLRYAMAEPPAGLDAPPGTVFVLDESHRVRLKERNYFDHPAFGVIALVTPQALPARHGEPVPRAR